MGPRHRSLRSTTLLVALGLGVAAVVVVLGGALARGTTTLIATGSASDATTTSTSASPSTSTTVVDENDDGVARVVIVGDSLVVGAESELAAELEADGVEHRFIAVGGTGLLTDQGVRLTELEAALDELHPDAVIIESCCNYDGAYRLFDASVVTSDSDLLWQVWEVQTGLMVDAAQTHGADVYLVETPRLVGDDASAAIALRIERFNEAYRAVAERTGATLLDWDEALYPGGVTDGLDDLRTPDGLHLTAAADDLVTAATWQAIAGSFS
jgi:lysophospholipase L1-like esterase